MTEILTESFCERCGTRYTFESARPRARLKGVRVLSRGLKNFVLSDDTSMDEAMAAARSDTDRELSSHQLDAFHKTFNFCMTCRQYTCPNCWNEVEARCLTCAPHLGHDVMPAPFPDLAPTGLIGAETAFADMSGIDGSNGFDRADAAGVEQTAPSDSDSDGDFDLTARLESLTSGASSTEPPSPRRSLREKATSQTGGLLERFRPGENIDAELAAFEADRAAGSDAIAAPDVFAQPQVVAEADPALVADAQMVAEPVVAEPDLPPGAEVVPEPQPVAAEPEPVAAEPEPEPVAAEPEPEPVAAEPEPEPVAAEPEPIAAEPQPQPVGDVVPQPTWRMVAPDPAPMLPGTPAAQPDATIPAAATAADPNAEPQWPTRPAWLGGAPAAGLPFLGRAATPQGGLEALWAESTREVVAPAAGRAAGGVQPCVSCGLSLSANARFCRRCGTSQPS
jgi:hypothetical protein